MSKGGPILTQRGVIIIAILLVLLQVARSCVSDSLATTELIRFDLTSCENRTYDMLWGLGSERIDVMGREGATCVFNLTSEVEASYTVSVCSVPASEKTAVVSYYAKPKPGEDRGQVKYSFGMKYCKFIREGNRLIDLDSNSTQAYASCKEDSDCECLPPEDLRPEEHYSCRCINDKCITTTSFVKAAY